MSATLSRPYKLMIFKKFYLTLVAFSQTNGTLFLKEEL
uniref:Uncharacterized protein n=1 Tax=Proteus mirabilis TaxID=584 RepID=A0A411AN30_PROMI|nr:hypothetical protein PGI2-PmCA72_014 [Proteus mirabilis]